MIKVNDVVIYPTMFPDRTSQVWNLPQEAFREHTKIVWKFENEAELFHLVQLVDLLRSEDIQNIVLFMPYLPYGRQDKYVSNDSTFALLSFMKVINTLGLTRIETVDPHSNVIREYSFSPVQDVFRIKNIIREKALLVRADLIAFPDAGAAQRDYADKEWFETITCRKVRDQQTGFITEFEILGEVDVKDKRILIADDICDGGMTFIILAKSLYEKGAAEVHLYVSHGIFSKGKQVLRDAGIKEIFTAPTGMEFGYE